MEIYANGKNISTFPFSRLFVCGEKLADTITFYLERFYEGKDMYGCSFLMRGVNSAGDEAQQVIVPEIRGECLVLVWDVSEYFTAAEGKLELELRAVRVNDDGETEQIMKYLMPPIYVAPSPKGVNTALPDTSEQLLGEISAAVSEGIEEIQLLIDGFDLSEVENRLGSMEQDIAVFMERPEVIPVTQREYDEMQHKKNALYVIVKEDD